ncbi:hypothetical protein V1508DRAFT_458063 [Lipomyces doorenjongii]|uniref:uncharacterized protein n=1 Tax=Lipomyces doorenjongii TaxID=383834 RepID=UPI0034CDD114
MNSVPVYAVLNENPPPYEDIYNGRRQYYVVSAADRYLHDEAHSSFYPREYQSSYAHSRYARDPSITYGTISGYHEAPAQNSYTYGPTSIAVGPSQQANSERDGFSKRRDFSDDVTRSTNQCLNAVRGSSDESDALSSQYDRSGTSDDGESIAEALHVHVRSPPSLDTIPPLRKPIVLSQMMSGVGVPFCRAYSRELESHGICCEEFLEFVDKLNVVLGLVGSVLGLVPSVSFQIAGAATQAVAKVGVYAVSNCRTESFMKQANRELFAPRRLRVEFKMLGLSSEVPFFAPLSHVNKDQPVNERRLAALDGYVSSLTFQVPPPGPQASVLARLSDKQVERQLKISENKLMKDRGKALKKIPGEHQKSSKEIKEVEKARREQEKELRKINKDINKLGLKAEKEKSNEQKDYEKEEKEMNSFKKILWIVVVNLE